MKKTILILAAVCACVFAICYQASAQYYSYYYPYYYAPPGYYPPSPTKQAKPVTPYYFRMMPDPYQSWRWDRKNRWDDYQQSMRNPLNPESDLSYMLRTF